MNAIEIIENVRQYDAELSLEQDRLVIRGRGEPLPDDLKVVIREHKAELMMALGATPNVVIAEVLSEIRPYLDAQLQRLPDSKLLVLVNWSIIHAWNRAAKELPK